MPHHRDVSVLDLGAAGDGKALDTRAVQRAIDICAKAGGGTVCFPPGAYKIGAVRLRSNITLDLDPRATIVVSRTMSDFTAMGADSYVTHMASRYAAFQADALESIRVVGGGVIDGNFAYDDENPSRRGPMCLNFEHCRNVVIRDITLVNNAGGASLSCFGCIGVEIVHLKDLWSFAGGPNISCCQDVLLDDVLVDGAQDDPICLKNDSPGYCYETRPPVGFLSQNIVIRNCTVRDTDHGAIKLGTGSFGVFRGIHITDCTFDNVTDMFRIMLYHTNLPEDRRRAIEDISFQRITLHNVKRLLNWGTASVDTPVINGVTVRDVVADGACEPSIIMGLPAAPIRNVLLERVRVGYAGREPPATCWLDARFVQGLTLRDVHLDLRDSVESALIAHNCKEIELDRITFQGARDDTSTVRIDEVQGLTVRNSILPDVRTFLRATGRRTSGLVFQGNDGTRTATLLETDSTVPTAALKSVAADVTYAELGVVTSCMQPNEPFQIGVTVSNPGVSGAARIEVIVDSIRDNSVWLWLDQGQSRRITLSTTTHYAPGPHQVRIGPLTAAVAVAAGPADLQLESPFRYMTPGTPGMPSRVSAQIRNVGGQSGSRIIDLSYGDKVVASRRVTLDPGQSRRLSIRHIFPNPGTQDIRLGDLPGWRFATFPDSLSGITRDGTAMRIEASGADLGSAPHAGVFRGGVEGDFVATVRIPGCDADTPYGVIWAGLLAASSFAEPDSAEANLALGHVPPFANVLLQFGRRGQVFSPSRFYAIPVWLKIERTGLGITGYISDDGALWRRPPTSSHPTGQTSEGLLRTDEGAARSLDVGIYLTLPDRGVPRVLQEFGDFRLETPVPQEMIEFKEMRLSATRALLHEPITATAEITNRGSLDGPVRVGLYVDDHEPFTKWVCLRRGETRSVSFDFTPLLINSKAALPHHDVHPLYWTHPHSISIGNTVRRTMGRDLSAQRRGTATQGA